MRATTRYLRLALIPLLVSVAARLIPSHLARSCKRRAARRHLQMLLDNEGITVVWQPVVDTASGQVIGVEALARFNSNAEHCSARWFDNARRFGMDEALEIMAVKQAMAILPHLPEDIYLACNVSAATLSGDAMVAVLEGLPLERLVLEITEHDIVEDYQVLTDILAPLRQRGLRVAVDDAGAGYASLRHILCLRPEVIKLDMSLVRGINDDPMRQALAASLVHFSGSIRNQLVAEGVETRAEFDTLSALGVQAAQGFYLHRPAPIAAVQSALAYRHRPAE